MNAWQANLDSIIQKINPLQLSKILEIGKILKEGLNSDPSNNAKAIQRAEKELFDNFDESSCSFLLSIIGS